MDLFNDIYPLYPENPDPSVYTEQEQEQHHRRNKELTFDDYCAIYSDDLWYLWCTIQEFRESSNKSILNNLDFANFCSMCYDNSTKY
jgi:hypothetical protein